MSDELKPCPFCGASDPSDVFVGRLQSDGRRWAVACEATDCLTEGPHRATKREAIAAWNTRATPKVKPLEWVDLYGDGSRFDTSSDHVLGFHASFIQTAHGYYHSALGRHETYNDAVEAHQADYERRILEALE